METAGALPAPTAAPGLASDSVGYAFILVAIGLSVFGLGLLLHRFGRPWTADPPTPPAADA
jgi:hypothetical protein